MQSSQYLLRERRLRDGKTFVVNSTFLALGGSTNVTMTLQNPNGSTKKIYIDRFEVDFDAGTIWGTAILNPSGGLPTGVLTPVNLAGSGSAGVGVARSGTASALSGGLPLRYLRINPPRFDYNPVESMICLPANSMFGLNLNVSVAANISIAIFYFEE